MTGSSCHGAPLPLPQGMTDLLARLDPDARILDFGCGDGTSVSSLVAGDWDAWGLDISEEKFANASDRSRLLLAEDGRSPFDDASFDLIVTHQVPEHVRDLRSVVAEIARLTKPEGYGLHVETISHSKLKSFPLGPTRPLAEWAMRTFRTVTLQTTKPTDARN